MGHSVARDLCTCGPSATSNPTTYCFTALVIVFKAMPKGRRVARGHAAATTAGRGAITTRSAATQSTTRGRGRGAAGLSRAASNAASRSSTQAALPNLDPHILAAIRAEIEAAFSAAGDPTAFAGSNPPPPPPITSNAGIHVWHTLRLESTVG